MKRFKVDSWEANKLKKELTTSHEIERSREFSNPYQMIYEDNSTSNPVKVPHKTTTVYGTSWHFGNTSFDLNELSRLLYVIILVFLNYGLLYLYAGNFDLHLVNYRILDYDTQYGLIQFICYSILVFAGFLVQREKIYNETLKEKIKVFFSLLVVFAVIGAVALFITAIFSSVVERIMDLRSTHSIGFVCLRSLLSGIIASAILIVPEILTINKE